MLCRWDRRAARPQSRGSGVRRYRLQALQPGDVGGVDLLRLRDWYVLQPRAGASDTLYEKLRKDKEEKARALEAKCNPKLKKPVKMKITFRLPGEDRKDGDLYFHVRIGPNDFDMDGAVEGQAGGVAPPVGLHGVLKVQTGAKQQESHHVPPKGLLGWMKGQTLRPAGTTRDSSACQQAHPHQEDWR